MPSLAKPRFPEQRGSATAGARRLEKAALHLQAGRLQAAWEIYERLLAADPTDPLVNYQMGLMISQQGRPDLAVPYLAAALKANPTNPQHWLSLAMSLLRAGRLPDARAILSRFLDQGFVGAAIDGIQASLVAALYVEASALYEVNRLSEAEPIVDTILLLDAKHTEAINLAANIAWRLGRFEHAYYLATTAISQDAEVAAHHATLGNVYKALEHFAEAAASFEHASQLDPANSEFRSSLGLVLHRQGRPDKALEALHQAIELNPNSANCHNKLGFVLADLGRTDEAIAYYSRALELDSALPVVHSNRLYAKMYSPAVSAVDQVADARAYGERFADQFLRRRPFPNTLDLRRKLRVGFVSADFRHHAVNFFFEPIISHLCRDSFESFAYSHTIAEDEATARLKGHFDHWRCIRSLNDDAAADLIEADAVDILVDLSGHTAGNRLLVMARKPAPIQVTWIGYPGTTGLKAIDYRFTDALTDPEGLADELNVETLWRLPHVSGCYQAPANSPDVIPYPPSERNGYITFGCFNRFTKVTDDTLRVWSEIMARVPDSRLLLEITSIDNAELRALTEARFERLGLPLDRVILERRSPANQYVLYNRIDIALDPFPYNGGTTSLDTLWMGVPFVALEGNHFVARMGATILTVAGLSELVAHSADEYVAIATALASDRERLRSVRHNLRDRMAACPLMDHKLLCRNVEIAFRSMWQRWVESQEASV